MSKRELRLAVASDHALIADAVRAAVASRGLDGVVIPWPDPEFSDGSSEPPLVYQDVGLVLCDLEPWRRLGEAQAVITQLQAPCLLLTSAPRGPLWGAMLECGVEAILSAATTLDETVSALRHLAAGGHLMTEQTRRELQAEWTEASADRELLLQRMQSLTPRERTVLQMLFAGDAVRTIAELLGVSEATVRSHVKAVLRKMDVSSQLAAVSVFVDLRDEGPDDWSGTG